MKASGGKGFGQGKSVRSVLPRPKKAYEAPKGRPGLRIIALSEAGRQALLRHREERSQAPMRERLMFRTFYDESVEREEPLTIVIRHKVQHVADMVPFESLRVPVDKALQENGAKEGIDYEVERL